MGLRIGWLPWLAAVVMAAVLGFMGSMTGCIDTADCEEIEDDAQALVAEYEACESDDSCVIVNMYELAGEDNCLEAFQCFSVIPEDADQEEFGRRARDLVEDYKGCQSCAIAGCINPSQYKPVCNEEIRRCELVPL